MSRRHHSGGFTLIEVILAFTALALVSAICYGAFHLGIRAVERGTVAVVTQQRLRSASDVMIRQMKSPIVYVARKKNESVNDLDDDEPYPYFEGTATEMKFVTAAGLVGGGGLAYVVYRITDDPPTLLLSERTFFTPDRIGKGDLEPARESRLLDGFQKASFEYRPGPDEVDFEDDEGGWRPFWDAREEDALPGAVRVTVEGLAGSDGARWVQEIPLMLSTLTHSQASLEVGGETFPRLPGSSEDLLGAGSGTTSGVSNDSDKEQGDESDTGDTPDDEDEDE